MRLRAAALATAALAASLPFAFAAAGDEPCDNGDLVITADGAVVEYDAPDLPFSSGDELIVAVDLSGTDFMSATVTVNASWTIEANDYDLFVNDEGPLGITALDGVGETASAGKVGHCDTFVVTVDNFTAVDPIDTVTLTFDVRGR